MTELRNFHLQGGSLINYAFEVSQIDARFHPVAAVYCDPQPRPKRRMPVELGSRIRVNICRVMRRCSLEV